MLFLVADQIDSVTLSCGTTKSLSVYHYKGKAILTYQQRMSEHTLSRGQLMRPYLSSKPPEGMLCHVLLQWYDMAEHKVDPKQHLPAQLLQMLPHVLLERLWRLQCLSATFVLGKGKKGLHSNYHNIARRHLHGICTCTT